jgi:hypothetical protein
VNNVASQFNSRLYMRAHNQFQLIKLSTASSFAQERGCCKFFPGVWKRRYIDALNRHRWLWRRRKISSAAIITFPARKAECALLLCVLILDEKCFQREAFTLQHEGKYWCVPLCCRDMFAPDGRAQAAIVIFHYAHLRDCSRCALRALNCGNNDVASFVSSSTAYSQHTQKRHSLTSFANNYNYL